MSISLKNYINLTDKRGEEAFFFKQCLINNVSMVKYLLDYEDCDINIIDIYKQSCLSRLNMESYSEIFKIVLQNKRFNNNTFNNGGFKLNTLM